uniref:Chemotaxis protein n=1 Tax=Candidatus Kentrum eta TaxID=2126337 RepID=A0A450UN78_9GAMM|nr:MAG: hypothetical protein BECKH772A_GA0070896_1006411 [Candidatus Kentron sp. H]VFJ94729.1 MAG: hypothetical protein BECKH772B_GA0070898_1006611 [Candidatus Kentron sp. H]VFK01339.1 MAG: hypothetical protein BECKH772C_GA0070978_1006310 [Candidatus Kentron sp. H]
MKLIIRQYLASLKERGELDAIVPDLLSELGLTVFSRPGRGTRQDGVDVAAVGSLDGEAEKVYLFSIKAGDLTRASWDGDALQSLRPSLNEILDAYIPNRLPDEHKGKGIVICLCFGGDIREQVRPQVEGYIQSNKKSNITFEEWNGDELAKRIQSRFLREELMPEKIRSQLRKALALLDEPEASYRHFSGLIRSLSNVEGKNDKEKVTAIRQINLCLQILFAWAREAGNVESAYLSGELALLHGWEIAKTYFYNETSKNHPVYETFNVILFTHQRICFEFLEEKIIPHVHKHHALSSAVRPRDSRAMDSLDVNLKLFDVLGRLAMGGIWFYWRLAQLPKEEAEIKAETEETIQRYMAAIMELIFNNPALLLPIKDEHAIDVCLAVSLLAMDANNAEYIKSWLSEMANRADFSFRAQGKYPCNIHSYSDLLDHPKREEGYLEDSTQGSILYPIIALSAALLDDEALYAKVQSLKEQHLKHCNFQYWYPDEASEGHFYTNSDSHGAALSHLPIEAPHEEFLEQLFGECENTPAFHELSAVKAGLWPLILVACRHYRLPVPLHLLQGFLVAKDIEGPNQETSSRK